MHGDDDEAAALARLQYFGSALITWPTGASVRLCALAPMQQLAGGGLLHTAAGRIGRCHVSGRAARTVGAGKVGAFRQTAALTKTRADWEPLDDDDMMMTLIEATCW